jgi:hypothetical protein
MKVKKWILLFFVFFQQDIYCQYLKFDKATIGTNVITVPSNEYWQVISYSASGWDWVGRIYSSTNQIAEDLIGNIPSTRGQVLGPDSGTTGNYGSAFAGAVIPGPAYFYFYSNSTYYFLFQKIKPKSEVTISKTTVVIPFNSVGNVEIKIEKSSDNINWVEALPGTYNTSTQMKIFRVRAIESE